MCIFSEPVAPLRKQGVVRMDSLQAQPIGKRLLRLLIMRLCSRAPRASLLPRATRLAAGRPQHPVPLAHRRAAPRDPAACPARPPGAPALGGGGVGV